MRSICLQGVQVAVEEERWMVIAIGWARFPYSLRKKGSAIIWKPLSSDGSDNDPWDRTFYISAIVVAAIAAIAAIAGEWLYDHYDRCDRWSFFFLSDRSDHSDGSDHMETGL